MIFLAVEIEKKFIISERESNKLKIKSYDSIIGIIQWYVDGAGDNMKSERIRMILSEDGSQKWIMGKKECINGDLIHRKESETQIEPSTIRLDDLTKYPFIIKTRRILNSPFNAEVVLDRLLRNPYLSYDIERLMEIELTDETDDIDKIANEVISYYNLEIQKDVSADFRYTNQAIAFRATKKNNDMEFQLLLNLLKKEIRSELDERQ
jgi:hypothetical protein